MIFVILGIIILIVSFFVALASLIREQNRVQDFTDNEKLPERRETIPIKKDNFGSRIVKNTDSIHQDKAIPPSTIDEVPLPWKDDVEGQAGLNEEEKEIQRIRADLKKLTGKVESKDWTDTSNEVKEIHIEPKKRLSGEFSLHNILRRKGNY